METDRHRWTQTDTDRHRQTQTDTDRQGWEEGEREDERIAGCMRERDGENERERGRE